MLIFQIKCSFTQNKTNYLISLIDTLPNLVPCSTTARLWTLTPVGPFTRQRAGIPVTIGDLLSIARTQKLKPLESQTFRQNAIPSLHLLPSSARCRARSPLRPIRPDRTRVAVARPNLFAFSIAKQVIRFGQNAIANSLLRSSPTSQRTFSPFSPLCPVGTFIWITFFSDTRVSLAQRFITSLRHQTFPNLTSKSASASFRTDRPLRPLRPVRTVLIVAAFSLFFVSEAKFVVDLSGRCIDTLPEPSTLSAGTSLWAGGPIGPRSPFRTFLFVAFFDDFEGSLARVVEASARFLFDTLTTLLAETAAATFWAWWPGK
jgi:hypothetical protein